MLVKAIYCLIKIMKIFLYKILPLIKFRNQRRKPGIG